MRSRIPTLFARTIAAAVLVSAIGCRSIGADEMAAASRPGHAACPVCSCEGDLACVDVRIGERTPRCNCGGKTYYFCSEQCRCEFEKRPGKYSSR